MKRGRILTALICLVLAGAAAAWLSLASTVLAQSETSVLGDLLSRALSTPSSRVSIGTVSGALSSDATIRNVVVSDRDGPYLRLDRARLIWRRAALFSRRLEIDRLEIGRLEILRRPAPAETRLVPASDEPLLPELPLKVEIKAFTLSELALGEPLLGTPARIGASGSARLGPPDEGLQLTLDARRIDAGGRAVIRLDFVPRGERLDLRVEHDEPAGGLVARLANLPGLPPIRLELSGTGVLDDWAATLDLRAGPDLGAKGRARIGRHGAERRLTLDLAARLEGVLPAPVAPVFAGVTRLDGSTRFLDGGAIALDTLSLTSRLARLDLSGTLTADRVVDLTANARALPNDGAGSTRALDAEIERLAFTGAAKGPLAAPRIEGRLEAGGVRMRQGRLGHLVASVLAEPTAGAARRLVADAQASGIALADGALARAVGDRFDLRLRGTWGADGAAEIETLRLTAQALDLDYAGRLGARVEGTLRATLNDLSRFADLAQRPGLAGAARLSAKLDGDAADRLAVDLDGSASGFALGLTAVDRLAGGRLALKGRAEWLRRESGIAARDLRLEGAAFTALANGRAALGAADLSLRFDVDDLKRLDERLSGRATADARLTGSLERADLTATVTAADARALGRPLRDVRLSVGAADLAGRLDASAKLSGSLAGESLSGAVRLRRPDPDGLVLDGLDLSVGSARIAGRAALDGAGLGEGTLTIAAPDLDALSPLVLTPLKGRLDGTLNLSRDGGRQGARLIATGRGIEVGTGLSLRTLDADAGFTDLYGRPVLDGRLAAEGLVTAGETFDRIVLLARGAPAVSDLELSATARGFALDARASLLPGDKTRLNLAALSASRGEHRFALAEPASITFNGGTATVSNLAITTSDSGRLAIAGTLGRQLDLSLRAQALSLAVAEIARPGLGLTGMLSGEAMLRGSPSWPEGSYRVSIARLATAETRAAGLPVIDANASGTLKGDEAMLEATVAAGPGARLQAIGRVPLRLDGALALKVTGHADAAMANAALGAGGQRVTGRVTLDARIDGTPGAPRVEGAATLSGGTFADPLQGIRLTGIEGRVTGRGDTIAIERLRAVARNGGTIGARGRVVLDPAAGFPGEIRLDAVRAELVASELVTAVASFDLLLQGPLASRPRLAGRVDLVSMDVSIPDRLPATVRPLAGTRHVAPPPQVRARLAAERTRTARQVKRGPAFDAALDLTLSAPNRIFVRGRGVDAELGGDLRLTGTSAAPVAVGAFELRRGRLSVVGQRLDFTRGRLAFAGDLAPDLDFLAETRAGDVTAQIVVTGPASQPAFAFASQPALPQDEVLSRLLFAKASGNLSAFQALQLAQAVAQFSGGGGPDVFDRTRRALGVDSLDITTGASGGAALGASRYIGDRLSVGVRAGAKPEDSAATATIDLTRRLKVQGEVGADGRSSVGVGAEWEY